MSASLVYLLLRVEQSRQLFALLRQRSLQQQGPVIC
jgi:hypothetical protein